MSSQNSLTTASSWISFGCLSALMAVAMGAFGAHGLAQKLSSQYLEVFKTAAHYQMIHSLALIAFGLWTLHTESLFWLPALSFTLGILLFSGSLYALALSGITWLGAITPLGGLSFLIGWASFAWHAFKISKGNPTP